MAKVAPKQKRFIQEYLLDLNATQAAIRAGYSPKTANEQGARLLAKASVQAGVQEAMKRREKRTEVTADRVVQELAKIAFSDLKDFVDFGPDSIKIKDSDTVDGSVLAEVGETVSQAGSTRTVKLHNKMKALELLGRHLGIFTEKHELSGPGGGPIQTTVDLSDVLRQAWDVVKGGERQY